MDDDEFISYCELHSQTELALFNGPQVARMIRLAGGDEKAAASWDQAGLCFWRSCDLTELCRDARKRRAILEETHDQG